MPASQAWNTPTPSTDLVPVEAFLQAASITYEQLLELLEVVWVRDGGAALTLQGLNDTCDLSIQSLAPAPLDAGVLDRVHRFLRLWRHAPWQMWELDLLLSSPAVAAERSTGRVCCRCSRSAASPRSPGWPSISNSPSTVTSTPPRTGTARRMARGRRRSTRDCFSIRPFPLIPIWLRWLPAARSPTPT